MITIIRAKKPISLGDFKEMWSQKELLYFFTWRDLKIRYKQTILGVLWALFQPFIVMVVFTVFFGKFGKIPSDNIPYPIFVYAGLLLWQLFSATLLQASNSLVSQGNLLTKVYFPRLILPISSLFSNLVDFLIASIILVGMMIYYQFVPSLVGLVVVPLLVIITCIFAVGLGLFLASLNVKYRDVKYILPFFVQLLLFVTPVIYPSSILGEHAWLLAINPMTGVIKAMRASLFGGQPINWLLLGISAITSLVILILGLLYFKKSERKFADLI